MPTSPVGAAKACHHPSMAHQTLGAASRAGGLFGPRSGASLMSDAVNSLRRCSSMRALLLVCPLSLFLAGGAALAQSVQRTELSTQKSEEEIKAIRERAIEWYNTCMEDWDQGTHMTKKEWKTTCERVARERGKWLLETQLWTPSSIVGRRADGPNFSLPLIRGWHPRQIR